MKIAIIGAGIFGSIAAELLSNSGHAVNLYDQKSQILSGASGNNSNRIHLGFHYPRDLDTAIQSRRGYESFRTTFLEFCNFNFPCIYAISQEGSKTSILEFSKFIKSANLRASEIDVDSLSNYGFDVSKISKAWCTDEGVIDINALKPELERRLIKSNVQMCLDTEIMSISAFGQGWTIGNHDFEDYFDLVVIATYGVDSLFMPQIIKSRSKSLFQATMILQANISAPQFGITVIDGDFITVLPKGFSDEFLIYAPGPSVLAQSTDLNEVLDVVHTYSRIREGGGSPLEDRFRHYFPDVNVVFNENRLITVRNIESSSTRTDKRVSNLEELAPNLYSVRSGKLDHAIEIAQNIKLIAQ